MCRPDRDGGALLRRERDVCERNDGDISTQGFRGHQILSLLAADRIFSGKKVFSHSTHTTFVVVDVVPPHSKRRAQ